MARLVFFPNIMYWVNQRLCVFLSHLHASLLEIHVVGGSSRVQLVVEDARVDVGLGDLAQLLSVHMLLLCVLRALTRVVSVGWGLFQRYSWASSTNFAKLGQFYTVVLTFVAQWIRQRLHLSLLDVSHSRTFIEATHSSRLLYDCLVAIKLLAPRRLVIHRNLVNQHLVEVSWVSWGVPAGVRWRGHGVELFQFCVVQSFLELLETFFSHATYLGLVQWLLRSLKFFILIQ